MDWLIVFSVIVFLIFINALYVAAEFSTVSTRPSRLAQKAKLGDQLAEDLLAIVENPRHLDTYIATCQVGITISSLALGFMGQSRIAEALSPLLVQYGDITDLLANSLSVTFILVIFSVLQILFGELIPKNIGIQFPERMALLTAIPMRMSIIVFKPLIWVFNGSGQILMKLFNLDISSEHTHIHAPQEIAMLVEESGAGGAINPEEQRLIKNTLKLRQAHARQVMIPRTKMLTAPDDMPPRDMLELLADSPYSRLPLYTGTVDNIVGVVHLKELLCFEKFNDSPDIHSIMHTVPFIPETMPVKNVFDMLQNRRFQVAIVMDEFGGTQGMVTLEDLIEEIFGDLQDEFDAHHPDIKIGPGNRLWLKADIHPDDISKLLHLEFPAIGMLTIGGLLLNTVGHLPAIGEEISLGNCDFRIEAMSGREITQISIAVDPEIIRKVGNVH